MKKLIVLLGVGCAIGFWGHFVFAAKSMGEVVEVSGKVQELKNQRGSTLLPLKLRDSLEMQDVVITGYSSTTRLLLTPEEMNAKVVFFVYENSKFKVDPVVMTGGKRSIIARLTQGLVRFIAKDLKGDKLFIVTPNGVVGVRGTQAEIGYYPHIKVSKDGKITYSVYGDYTSADAKDGKTTVVVNAGHVEVGHAPVTNFHLVAIGDDLTLGKIKFVEVGTGTKATIDNLSGVKLVPGPEAGPALGGEETRPDSFQTIDYVVPKGDERVFTIAGDVSSASPVSSIGKGGTYQPGYICLALSGSLCTTYGPCGSADTAAPEEPAGAASPRPQCPLESK